MQSLPSLERPSLHFFTFATQARKAWAKQWHRRLCMVRRRMILKETIAMETHTVLDVAISNQVVIYEIKENESAKSEFRTPRVTDHAEDGIPSE